MRVLREFILDETGAITVDYVVLSAAAVGMAIATTDVLRVGIGDMTSNLEEQLRTRNLSDDFVVFDASHFGPSIQSGFMNETDANELFNLANQMTNASIMSLLEEGFTALSNGVELSDMDYAELSAIASVARQRNIADSQMLDAFFAGEGGGPAMTN